MTVKKEIKLLCVLSFNSYRERNMCRHGETHQTAATIFCFIDKPVRNRIFSHLQKKKKNSFPYYYDIHNTMIAWFAFQQT